MNMTRFYKTHRDIIVPMSFTSLLVGSIIGVMVMFSGNEMTQEQCEMDGGRWVTETVTYTTWVKLGNMNVPRTWTTPVHRCEK